MQFGRVTLSNFRQPLVRGSQFGGELLLTNVHGENIGFIEGKYVDQLSDAELFDDVNDDRWRLDFSLLRDVFPDANMEHQKIARTYYFHHDT